MLVEVDRTGRGAYNASKYVAYDHFLGGWCLRTRHWGKERRTRPVVVFVAHSPKAMLALLYTADQAMTLGFAAAAATTRHSSSIPVACTPPSPASTGCSRDRRSR